MAVACTSLSTNLLLHPPPKASAALRAAKNLVACYPHDSTLSTDTTRNGAGVTARGKKPLGTVFAPRRETSTAASAFSSSAGNDLRPELDDPEGIISGEWPENFSLLSFEDLRVFLESHVISRKLDPSTVLKEVMSAPVRTVTAEQTLEEIEHHFEVVSGLPVVDGELRCVGVISKKDKDRASDGSKSKVGDIMSSPAFTLSPDKTVMEAAALMLKMKVHRIPILNEEQHVVGVVTRSDIFRALESMKVDEYIDNLVNKASEIMSYLN